MKKSRSTFLNHAHFSLVWRLPVITAFLLLIALQGLAQGITITGRVTSDAGDPLSGVSVTVKGTTTGTATNAEGNYSITVPNRNATLVFSYVGYTNREIRVGNDNTLNVVLSPSAATTGLAEVVVIGYGTAAKRDLAGSIVKISGEEVADRPNSNPVASLQGKVAGLSIVNSGTPGQQPDIRIRGTVSIGQVHPLYVVDGIFQDNIDYLNPNDIESIEILKDPSSLAIFGVRGATGVIAITTKKARAGQTIINFSTSYGFKKLVDKIEMANAEQFKTLFAQERANNGITEPFDYTGLDANTDWIEAVTQTGNFSNNNLSVTGGSERNRFNFGVGYTLDQGIVRHEELQRITLNLGDEFKVYKGITVGANLNVSRQKNPYDATWVLDAARKVMPLISSGTKEFRVANPYNNRDTVNMQLYSLLDVGLQSSGVINPLLEVENTWNKTKSVEYRSVGSVFGEVAFLKHFTARSTLYADISNLNKRVFSPRYYAYNPRTNVPELYRQRTSIAEDDNTWRKFQQDHVLTYKNRFGEHGITATGGFTTFYFGNFNRSGSASQPDPLLPSSIPIPDDPRFWYLGSGFEDPASKTAGSSQNEFTTVSWLARVLYNYQNRYYLNASFRDDASSRIPGKNRHQQFWALGAAWELSREGFMQDIDFFDFLKLKGSIGVLGNQSAFDPNGQPLNYPFYPNLRSGQSAPFGIGINASPFVAAVRDYDPNPNLKWETVNAHEIGVEFNALDNRLRFEANYFNKKTNDLMTYVDRTSLGLDNKLVSSGSIRNWGEELMANWTQNFSQDLTLNVGGNITFLKNEVLSLSDELPTGVLIRGFANNASAEARTQPGHPIGSYFGYVVEGIYQSETEILRSPVASSIGAYRPGDFKFKDVNGDGFITADDRTFIGNPTPKFTYGGTVNLTYKGISLDVDVNGVYGNQIFRVWGSLESPFQRVNYAAFQIDAWHGPGTSNWVPLVSQGDRFNYNGSTYNIEDGSYFRLRNVQLAYSFPRSVLTRFKMNNLRIYANVQNLKTWKNNFGYSPEFPGDATAFGFDFAGGALPVVTTFGLNVTF
jgi:TonB-linked SusC/RagA family outer membrane protein